MKLSAVVLSVLVFAGTAPAFAANSNANAGAAPAASAAPIEGNVTETMNAAGYTYLLVDTGTRKVWVAAPAFAVKTGDRVTVAGGSPMPNYRSKTLNRTFDVVYFADGATVNGKPAAPTAAPAPARAAPSADLSNIKRVPNGHTVAEIYAGAGKLTGKKITLRARVVKYNGGILGKNWLHLRDGSGAEGTNDLTVTSLDKAKVGDLVVVTGTLAANRDFGGGYKYALMLEEATITVE